MYYRDKQDFDHIRAQFNRGRVVDEINRTKTHKFEVEENLNKFIDECRKQIELIDETKIVQYIYFWRKHNYHTNRVEYEAGVRNTPQVANGQRYEWSEPGTIKIFSGREKKQAIAYVEELVGKYKCDVTTVGIDLPRRK
jgi:hypothetical protein